MLSDAGLPQPPVLIASGPAAMGYRGTAPPSSWPAPARTWVERGSYGLEHRRVRLDRGACPGADLVT
jgi:hypothetical protein